jgi:hypothetical protein
MIPLKVDGLPVANAELSTSIYAGAHQPSPLDPPRRRSAAQVDDARLVVLGSMCAW